MEELQEARKVERQTTKDVGEDKKVKKLDKKGEDRDRLTRELQIRKTELRRKPIGEGKLAQNWEGPYKIIRDIRKGAYKIVELSRRELPWMWNAASLRAYYN
ncbi:hypothetical protein Cni_G16788 [Canna indica]|uniref:Uncharacterized protein n=1 Tax=Canna indica TaxID=4628 RepID=A0AAQ3KLJ7_9LILI|nr:hypothetical protein Cni_G16788 [Canna indica]